jgi:hypothetical protein
LKINKNKLKYRDEPEYLNKKLKREKKAFWVHKMTERVRVGTESSLIEKKNFFPGLILTEIAEMIHFFNYYFLF